MSASQNHATPSRDRRFSEVTPGRLPPRRQCLVSQNDAGFVTEISVFHVKIGMAYAAALIFSKAHRGEGTQRFLSNINPMILCDNSSFITFSFAISECIAGNSR